MKLLGRKVLLCQQTIKNLIQVTRTCTPQEFLDFIYAQKQTDIDDALAFIVTVAAEEQRFHKEDEIFQNYQLNIPDC